MNIEKNLRILKKMSLYVLIFVVMLILFCISMIASYAIPNQKIQFHIKESVDVVLQNNKRPFFRSFINNDTLDLSTDELILNTAMNKGKNENEGILIKAFENSRFTAKSEDEAEALRQTVNYDNIYNNKEYARYWHGIQVIIRPLLLFLNYEEIRYLFMIIMFILLFVTSIQIQKNLSLAHSMAFVFSNLAIGFFVIPASLQYVPVFAIMLISVSLINFLYKKNKEWLYPYLFFIIGGLTTFFDLLTTPLLTLGIPLIYAILLKTKEEATLGQVIKEIVQFSILWGISYVAIFFSKWLIASLVLHKDVITDAINQILFRTNGNEQYPVTRMGAVKTNIDILFNNVLQKIFIGIIILWIVVMLKNKKKLKECKMVVPLTIIAIYPYIWYIIFAGHSKIHAFFTFRVQLISLISILYSMIECIDLRKLQKPTKKYKRL